MGMLGKQLQSIENELDILTAGEDNRRIIDELDQAIEDLAPTQNKLEEIISIFETLQSAPEINTEYLPDESEVPQRKEVEVAVAAMKEGWSDDPSTIRQKGLVRSFVETANVYLNCIESKNTEIWKLWVEELELKFRVLPSQLESVSSVPSNSSSVESFKKHEELFKEESKQPTDDLAKISRISKLSIQLQEIQGDIKFDYPKTVYEFFDEIGRLKTFPLCKVGPELLEWLTENDALKDLEIKFKAR